jgi:hypothetical protein
MTDSTGYPRDEGSGYPGMPRWVKVSLVIVGALAVLFAVLMATAGDGGGGHGPGNHSLVGIQTVGDRA